MSHQIINAALAERLKLLGKPTAYENAAFEPVAGVLYLRENMLPIQTANIGIALGSTRDYRGIYQVTVMAPRDGYKAVGYAAADEVAAHFARGMKLVKSGVTVLVMQNTIAPAFVTGDRWAIPVSIDYRALIA